MSVNNKSISCNRIFENKIIFLIIFTLFQPFFDVLGGKRFSIILIIIPIMFFGDMLRHRIVCYRSSTKNFFLMLIGAFGISLTNSSDYMSSLMWIYIWIIYYIIYIWSSQYKIEYKLFDMQRIIKVYIICGIIISILGIFQYIYFNLFNGWDNYSNYVLKSFLGSLIYGNKTAQMIALTGSNWINGLVGFRGTSIFGGPDSNGMFACLILALAISLKSLNYNTKMINISIVVSLLNLILTFGRASWLNFIFILISLMSFKKKGIKTIVKLLIGFTCIIIIILLINPSVLDKVNIALASIVNTNEQSNAGRLDIWQSNFVLFFKHPILGWGIGNYNFAYEYMFNKVSELINFSAHNAYFLFLVEDGILGTTFFIMFYVKNILDAKKIYMKTSNNMIKVYSMFVFCCTIGILVQYVFDYDFSNFRLLPLLMLNFGILNNIIRNMNKCENLSQKL